MALLVPAARAVRPSFVRAAPATCVLDTEPGGREYTFSPRATFRHVIVTEHKFDRKLRRKEC